jgi:hypothetical protein
MISAAGKQERRRLTLELSRARIAHLDALKREWGLRNRGDVLERLLDDLFPTEYEGSSEIASARGEQGEQQGAELDDQVALVLVGSGEIARFGASLDTQQHRSNPDTPGSSRPIMAIDLPGFVRRRSRELRRSLQSPAQSQPSASPLPRLAADQAQEALTAARDHWISLYGSEANAAVLEAAMTWLAQDIWPQAEPVEGRSFTWSAASALMQELVEGWGRQPASFELVIVTAGVVEDPFSASTLVMRIPTLIHRFVQRFRRRPKGTSFQTLEHTMTLQGALRLLEIPAELGQRVTLSQIREAYRELALRHHPDSGGSVESMRRLNEAYQLLKELYRQPDPSAAAAESKSPASG